MKCMGTIPAFKKELSGTAFVATSLGITIFLTIVTLLFGHMVGPAPTIAERKAEIVRAGGFRTLILGTSYLAFGFGAETQSYFGPTTNGAVPNITFSDMLGLLRQAPVSQEGGLLIVDAAFGIGLQALPDRTSLWTRLTLPFLLGDLPPIDAHGFMRIGPEPQAEGRFELSLPPLRLAPDLDDRTAKAMADLEAIVTEGVERGYRVVLVIPPIHALWLEAMQARGFGAMLDRWPHDVMAIAARATAKFGASSVLLYDFSIYDGVTVAMPSHYGHVWRSPWFVDISHATRAVGLDVARAIMGGEASFGTRLTADNIEAEMTALQKRREAFRRAHAAEIGMIDRAAGSFR